MEAENLAAMLTDLANLADAEDATIKRMQQKYPGFLPKDSRQVPWLKTIVQQLWTGNPHPRCIRDLENLLLSGQLGSAGPEPLTPLAGIIGIDWRHGRFVYRPQTTLQRALAYLMENSHVAKICANPDCRRYFIADRSNTQYCSEKCLEAARRETKRAWWDEKGDEWRRKRTKSKPKQGKPKSRRGR